MKVKSSNGSKGIRKIQGVHKVSLELKKYIYIYITKANDEIY